jgi:hypothetical protein
MAYYDEDSSYYCYSTPAHYVNTSSYDDYIAPVPTSTYYDDSLSYDISPDPAYYHDTPSYAEDISPDPIYFEDEVHPAYRDHPDEETKPDWSSPLSHEDELEVYAEIACERTYSEDEIHPAYLDHPVADYHEDPTELIQPHTTCITERQSEPICSPTNLYSGHDNSSNDELTKHAEYLEELLDEMRVWDVEDAENKALGRIVPGMNPPPEPYRDSTEFKRLAQEAEYIATILRKRIEEIVEDEVLDDCSDETRDEEDEEHQILQSPAQPQPTPSSHHLTSAFLIAAMKHREPRYHLGPHVRHRRRPKLRSYKFRNTRTTPPPDIRPLKPFPPSPNIPVRQPQLHPPYNHNPPDIRLPPPLPLAPNIHTRHHHHKLHVLNNQHPPDILTPKPFPPSPNILLRPSPHQQPRRPAYTRPRRKHPPTHTSQHCHHNAKRRIAKKLPKVQSRCSRMNITWRGPDE